MPRTRKTQSGAPAQKIGATPGQNYGMGVQQMQLQRAMPAPNNAQADQSALPTPSQMPPPPQAAQPPAQQQPQMTMGDVIAQAQGMAGQGGLLNAPTSLPNQPVTAGLPSGPGPGPEVLGNPQASKAGQWLRALSARTGDPTFARMADRANV